MIFPLEEASLLISSVKRCTARFQTPGAFTLPTCFRLIPWIFLPIFPDESRYRHPFDAWFSSGDNAIFRDPKIRCNEPDLFDFLPLREKLTLAIVTCTVTKLFHTIDCDEYEAIFAILLSTAEICDLVSHLGYLASCCERSSDTSIRVLYPLRAGAYVWSERNNEWKLDFNLASMVVERTVVLTYLCGSASAAEHWYTMKNNADKVSRLNTPENN